MPDPTGIGLAGALLRFVQPVTSFFLRGRKLAESELGDLTIDLRAVLAKLRAASVEAQVAVKYSPNDPLAQEANMAAVRLATEVGQDFSCLFDTGGLLQKVKPSVVAARLEFRKIVTDEINLEMTDPSDRQKRTAEIEAAATHFHQSICEEAFRHWGIGVGPKAGKLKGRRFPR